MQRHCRTHSERSSCAERANAPTPASVTSVQPPSERCSRRDAAPATPQPDSSRQPSSWSACSWRQRPTSTETPRSVTRAQPEMSSFVRLRASCEMTPSERSDRSHQPSSSERSAVHEETRAWTPPSPMSRQPSSCSPCSDGIAFASSAIEPSPIASQLSSESTVSGWHVDASSAMSASEAAEWARLRSVSAGKRRHAASSAGASGAPRSESFEIASFTTAGRKMRPHSCEAAQSARTLDVGRNDVAWSTVSASRRSNR
mmetsp:Transcript_49387/g.145772  ORF Transcript_49387/g.145772 Transcript_49387/m.145772 type:complete len:258 (+) Transcript_49387:1169-1942(+)